MEKCVKLVINKNYTEMRGQRNIKRVYRNSVIFSSRIKILPTKHLKRDSVYHETNEANKLGVVSQLDTYQRFGITCRLSTCLHVVTFQKTVKLSLTPVRTQI